MVLSLSRSGFRQNTYHVIQRIHGIKNRQTPDIKRETFEVLGAKPELKRRIPQITGVEIKLDELEKITVAVGQFESWLTEHLDGNSVLRERPILALDAQGTVVPGTADLIVETSEDPWVIDHKSDQVDDSKAAFVNYRSQLESYANALNNAGKQVLGTGIRLTGYGVVR